MPDEYPITPDAVAETAQSFAVDAPIDIPGIVGRLVAIHTHVRATIEYLDEGRDPGEAQQPTTTLQRGIGNCSDQAVLMVSLCEAVDIKARIVEAVSPQPAGHAIPEARLDGIEPRESVSAFHDAYTRHDHATGEYGIETDDEGTPWIPVDTALAQYIGDIQSLETAGFVSRDDDEWWWSALATDTGSKRFPGNGCIVDPSIN